VTTKDALHQVGTGLKKQAEKKHPWRMLFIQNIFNNR
jgi:hypothetical protein